MPKSNKDDICKYITWYLLKVPKLFDELPQILSSLDAGEVIGTSFIQDTVMRDALDHIMSFLPTVQTKDGWIRDRSSSSVIGHIFNKFLKDNVIVQPSSLTISQTQASRSAPLHLLKIIQKFPEIIDDLKAILETLLDENAVDISNLENEEVSECLVSLLGSLGLKEGEDGYKISSAVDHDALKHFKRIFDTTSTLHVSSQKPDKDNSNSKLKVESDDSSSNSDDSDSDNENENDDIDINRKRKASEVIGPARPNQLQMKLANDYNSKLNDDGDDEYIGPSLDEFNYSKSIKMMPIASSDPIGGKIDSAVFDEDNITESNNNNGQLVREEWMMTIGENKTLADLGAAIVTNRQFQRGKEADKIARKLAESKVNVIDPIEEEKQRKIEEEDRKLRGDTLMEQHISKKNTEKANGKKEKHKSFDRDKDFVVTHKMVNSIQVKQIVAEAQKLDSRFSRSSN